MNFFIWLLLLMFLLPRWAPHLEASDPRVNAFAFVALLEACSSPHWQIENIAQQHVFPKSHFCRAKLPERLPVPRAMDTFSIYRVRRLC